MTNLRTLRQLFLPAALGLSVAACSVSKHGGAGAGAFAPPTEFKGALTNGNNIELTWKNNATEAGGLWVEFTTPGAEFVMLEPFWPDHTAYQHPDLAPQTEYIYRLKPFFGRPSEVVSVTTGKTPPEGTPDLEEEGPLPEKGAKPVDAVPKKSIRSPATIAEAAPVGVTATLASPLSVDIRWQDRAKDEDGYLVEISADPAAGFQVCALLPPDTTSFKKTHLPPEMKVYFRVRGFFYGKTTGTVSIMTPPEKKSASAAPEPKKSE